MKSTTPHPSAPNGGRTLPTLLAGLVIVVALLAWASDLSTPRATSSAPERVRTEAPSTALGAGPDLTAPERTGTGASARPVSFEKSFQGTGKLTVTVDVPPGVEIPAQWTLVLERGLFSEGDEHAVPRRIDFEREGLEVEVRGDRPTVEVEIDDVAYGGYSVSVDAIDMNTTRQECSLFAVAGQPDLPGRKNARIMVRLTPAGFLDGRVVDEELGGPIEGCAIQLTDLRTREVLTTTSQATGVYVFPSMKDGRYRLDAGEPESPLVTLEINYTGPEMSLDPIEVPRAASIIFRIVDELDGLVPNALIEGYGKNGTNLSVRTDLYGEARVPFLLAGDYRVRVLHPTGRKGKIDFTLVGDEVDRIVEGVVRR